LGKLWENLFTESLETLVGPSKELLDQILLWLGLVGELMYSVAGLVGLTGDAQSQPLAVLLFFVHIFRLIQVGTQTFLIYLAARVRVGASNRHKQPGKQAITFLLAANLSIFLMNLFESEKPGISESIIDFYGKRSWVFLVRSFSPLTIFYRFHSSVCLAEIWKNVYANK
uniref:RSN1_7TM domain-containing protein n=1 Tax=Heligmosomoides polygyrus TaxID=6339 RepID=A0A183F6H3_HELPZ